MKKLILIGVIISLMLSSLANAAIFVQIDGIDGESKDENHSGWMDALSVEWGTHRPARATGQTRRRGNAVVQDVTVSKSMDSSTPQIVQPMCDGARIPEVKIDLCTTSSDGLQHCYMEYKLKNVIVSSYSFEGDSDDDGVPVEKVSFNFKELEMEFNPDPRSGDLPSAAVCTR